MSCHNQSNDRSMKLVPRNPNTPLGLVNDEMALKLRKKQAVIMKLSSKIKNMNEEIQIALLKNHIGEMENTLTAKLRV